LCLLVLKSFVEILFILGILEGDVSKKVMEKALIVDDQFVNDGSVDVVRREFVLAALLVDVLSHIAEVARDLWRIA
jgi:hypothetical protein